ncbi:MAG: hypothetical protein ACOX85_12205 [Candidatus Pararuminococcus gallinarum]|jgi:hypothetical protein|nr:MAG TPA: hypothetical protein [Caudoviricetes sp.]
MIEALKEIKSVKTELEANEHLAKGWRLLEILEPKEFILGRYENRERNKI